MNKRLLLLVSLLCLLAGSFYYHDTYSRPYLTVIGYVKMADGLGRQTAELINAFKDEMRIGFIPTHRNRYQDVPKPLMRILKNKKRPLGKVILFEDCLGYPGHYPHKKILHKAREDQIRIAYSMFESSRIPGTWVEILNTHFDAVAVPDPFLVKVYEESGVRLPIFVIPLAIDISDFLAQPLKKTVGAPFTFANLSSCVHRKNQITLIRAFAKAFGNDPNLSLRINCRAQFDHLGKKLKQEAEKLGLSNVHISINSLSKQEYIDFFHQIDCYINLSKGEGFSIQPREAMALGIPTIVSDNTAQSTLIAGELAIRVPSDITEPALYDWGDIHGDFYNCTVEDAASVMKHVYQNYSFYLNRGLEARAWASQYQYHRLKPLYSTLIKPKRIVLGNENKITEDTLITNSPSLYKKYQFRD